MKQVIGFSLLAIAMLSATILALGPKQPDTSGVITLSESNTVSLNTPIEGSTIKEVSKRLLEVSDNLSSKKPIYLVLNSPGGSIEAGNELIELAKGLPQDVHTITLFSASMSFQISQNLGKRYMTSAGTMMSHRAAVGGVEGNIPGNAFTRLYYYLEMVTRLDQIAADRAGMNIEDYQKLISNELWMGGEQAVDLGFADEVVKVKCDKTLRGPGPVQHIRMFIFSADVTFDKCPLITSPTEVEGDKRAEQYFNSSKQDQVNFVNGR